MQKTVFYDHFYVEVILVFYTVLRKILKENGRKRDKEEERQRDRQRERDRDTERR
jgi:hypothetical protein